MAALPQLVGWLRDERLGRFAVRTIESIAQSHPREAIAALSGARAAAPAGVSTEITDALRRLNAEAYQARDQRASAARKRTARPMRGGASTRVGDLHGAFSYVLDAYPTARSISPFAGHPLAAYLREELPDMLASYVPAKFGVEGSAGIGQWAETPWVRVFDPDESPTAQEGLAAVYVFRGDGAGMYLSLLQGITSILESAGPESYVERLRRSSILLARRLPDPAPGEFRGPLDLPGKGTTTRGYRAASVTAIPYQRQSLPDNEALQADLERMLTLYESLI